MVPHVAADGGGKVTSTSPGGLAARYHLSDGLAARLAGNEALTDALVADRSGRR